MKKNLKRITIVGPESTGKSQLASQLADEFATKWVPEFARNYINKLNRPYDKDDLLEIAKGQLLTEDQVAKEASGVLFCDTNLIVIKIWSDHKYGHTHPWILRALEDRSYDFYLLANTELPWEEDPQREHPNMRNHFYDRYLEYLEEHKLPYGVVSGLGHERLANAIATIKSAF